MVSVLGVDPGTRSFDLVIVEDGRVVWEESIDTARVAGDPGVLLEAIRDAGHVDAIAGPSGYGVPVTPSSDVVDPERFAVEVLLLSTREEIEEGVARGDPGIMVYKALAETVKALVEGGTRTFFIPGVIHLPTLDRGAKYNRIDIGTADKLSVALLASYLEGGPRGGRFLVLEMGYGYNALMLLERGRITWALGGTTLSPGFLTAGPLDLEAVALGRRWGRSDVFHGGVMGACGALDPSEAVERASEGGLCREAYEAMMESLATIIAGLAARRGVRRLLLSGRLARERMAVDDLASRLPGVVEVERLGLLEGAERSKHAAQGYALVVEGLLEGRASEAVEAMKVMEACGTALDHVSHPRLAEARRRIQEAYKASVKNPRLCNAQTKRAP